MNSQLRRVTIVLSLLVPLAAHAANLKFHAATGTEPVIGRYLVTLDTSIPADQASASAEALARAYHGQLEPFASSEIRQFAIAMLPGRARTLSADPRVREVTEIAQSGRAPSPPPANSSATLAGHLTPIARDVSSSGTYLYDGSGDIKSIGSDSFVYDVDGRLMQATVQASQQSYTYDAFGNRLSATRAAGATGCVGGCEAVVTVNHQNNHLTEQTYDEAGNVASGFGAAYTYDGTGMVTRATVGSDDRIFVYTADDERLAVRNGVSWTWTVRGQGNKVLREFTSTETSSSPLVLSYHTWSKDYVWRDGLLFASVFQSTSGPTTYHYHLDHLGTPRMITANGGVLVAKHTYYPFGAEMDIAPHESAVEAMKFTGHERDIVAANNATVDYMHARFYNANLGRFLSVDPILGAPSKPQSWNRYTYVDNNSLSNTDPTGKCSAPKGLQEGQVGVCIEAFIAAARIGLVGFGDRRGFTRNDSDASARVSFKAIIDPHKGTIVDQFLRPGVTKAGLLTPAIAVQGTADLQAASTTTDNGTKFGFFINAKNGLSAVNTFGSISILAILDVSKSGNITVDPNSRTKGYPSIEGYQYKMVNGQLVIETLFQLPETETKALKGPMDVPLVK
jgi:RHS repeat-associated protein